MDDNNLDSCNNNKANQLLLKKNFGNHSNASVAVVEQQVKSSRDAAEAENSIKGSIKDSIEDSIEHSIEDSIEDSIENSIEGHRATFNLLRPIAQQMALQNKHNMQQMVHQFKQIQGEFISAKTELLHLQRQTTSTPKKQLPTQQQKQEKDDGMSSWWAIKKKLNRRLVREQRQQRQQKPPIPAATTSSPSTHHPSSLSFVPTWALVLTSLISSVSIITINHSIFHTYRFHYVWTLSAIHYTFLTIFLTLSTVAHPTTSGTPRNTSYYYVHLGTMAGLATFANVISNYSLRYNTISSYDVLVLFWIG